MRHEGASILSLGTRLSVLVMQQCSLICVLGDFFWQDNAAIRMLRHSTLMDFQTLLLSGGNNRIYGTHLYISKF